MNSSLVRLDGDTGALLGRWRLHDPRLRLRHLAGHPGRKVLGIALQAEHDDTSAQHAERGRNRHPRLWRQHRCHARWPGGEPPIERHRHVHAEWQMANGAPWCRCPRAARWPWTGASLHDALGASLAYAPTPPACKAHGWTIIAWFTNEKRLHPLCSKRWQLSFLKSSIAPVFVLHHVARYARSDLSISLEFGHAEFPQERHVPAAQFMQRDQLAATKQRIPHDCVDGSRYLQSRALAGMAELMASFQRLARAQHGDRPAQAHPCHASPTG